MATYAPTPYDGETGTFQYTIGFPYAQTADVKVYVDSGSGWVLDTDWYFANAGADIKWDTPDEPQTGETFVIKRVTDISALLVTFASGSGFVGADANTALKQAIYAIDELQVPAFDTGWKSLNTLVAGAADIEYLHNLGATPTRWAVQLKCTSTELGFAVDDVIDGTSSWPSPLVRVNATKVIANWGVFDDIQVEALTTFAATLLDQTKWDYRILAWR